MEPAAPTADGEEVPQGEGDAPAGEEQAQTDQETGEGGEAVPEDQQETTEQVEGETTEQLNVTQDILEQEALAMQEINAEAAEPDQQLLESKDVGTTDENTETNALDAVKENED